MKLSDFEKGQIIHRTAPTSSGEYSFIETPIELYGVESGLIFFMYVEKHFREEGIQRISLIRYDDDNWDLFPLKYLRESETALKEHSGIADPPKEGDK